MTYNLYIGDRTFSSWSLRGWLMMEKFNMSYRTHVVGLYSGTMAQDLASLAPARLVPAMQTPEGDIIGESLAMAETLAEQNPYAGFWPQDPRLRIRARWLCAEMASGFSALRNACPMQLQHVNSGFVPDDAVLSDLSRLEAIWASARELANSDNKWLLGDYCLADAFYAPVAARIIGYNLPVSDAARAYCQTTIEDLAFKEWRAEGLKTTYDPFPYPTAGSAGDWPA